MNLETMKSGKLPLFARGLLLAAMVFAPAVALAGQGNPAEPGVADPGATESWGEDTQVVKAGRFYIASQPDREALERARAEGVTMVISLRSASESDWDEAAEAASLGLEFHRVPVDGMADELASEPLVQTSEIVQASPDAKILVHCSTGTRASAWFATYLADYLGMDVDEAIDVATRTGLRQERMRDKVRAYLER